LADLSARKIRLLSAGSAFKPSVGALYYHYVTQHRYDFAASKDIAKMYHHSKGI
jgi:hypothetical protein